MTAMGAETVNGPAKGHATGTGWTDEAWDAYVRSHPKATYLQVGAWARVKAATGWTSSPIANGRCCS